VTVCRRQPKATEAHVPSLESLKISEIFATLQGEGASAGAPALFVRLALCNLRCSWCDTRYTWDFDAYSYADEVRLVQVEDIAARIASAPEGRVVLTGGEPLLQQAALARLLALVPPTIQVEIETNGTLAPEAALLSRVDQWNVSPKLAHAGDPESRRIRREVLAILRDSGRAFLKFVVQGEADLTEIDALLRDLEWPRERVFLMPEAVTPDVHEARLRQVASLCHANGLRLSPRLHIQLWGGERAR
jgi:organic radical activating enzyme